TGVPQGESQLAGGGVPEHPGELLAPRGDVLAVGAKGQGEDGVGGLLVEGHGLAADGHVPEPDRLVVAAGGQPLAVGAEGQAPDGPPVPAQVAERPAGGQVPEADGPALPGEGEPVTVGAQGHGVDRGGGGKGEGPAALAEALEVMPLPAAQGGLALVEDLLG